ncbi:MAG: hypothetical protein DRN20_02455, partial [Thermoplasmata archaeon]
MARGYIKALELTKKIEEKARETTLAKQRAESKIKEAEELIKKAEAVDADVKRAVENLESAREKYNIKDYKSSFEDA